MSCENYDPCFPDQHVVDRYLPIWAAQPAFRSKPAFIWADGKSATRASITYSELNSSADVIASNLRFTFPRGDTVLVLCSPGLQLIKVIFACQRAGLVAVPIAPPEPSYFSTPIMGRPAHHHLIRAISQSHPVAAIAQPLYISALRRAASTSTVDRTAKLLNQLQWLSVEELDQQSCSAGPSEYSGCGPNDTYLIQYTSGATGIPKPVLVTAGSAAHNVRAARLAYDLQPNSTIVSWLPQYHDCGLMFLLLTVISGATCVLTSPSAFLQRPRVWLELVTEFRATCTPVPSFALPLVITRGGAASRQLDLGSMRNLILINEPIYRSSVELFVNKFATVGLDPTSISPSYGLAENCTFVSTAWRCTGVQSLPAYNKLLPSARLSSCDEMVGIEITVVDEETLEPVEDGVEGEVWVSSPSNASGYLKHPSLTREVFGGRLQGVMSHRFVRTGDRGVVKGEERYLYIVGRTSDAIRIPGRLDHVHPHYIETAAYSSCTEDLRGGCIAVLGVRSSMEEEEVVVVVAELRRGGERGRLGDYKGICEGIREGVLKEERVFVGSVVLVDSGSLPKTTSGKLQRWEAKARLMRGMLPVVFQVQYSRDHGEVGKEGVGGQTSEKKGHLFSLVSCL